MHGLYGDVAHHVALLQTRLVFVVHACRCQSCLRTLTSGHGYLEGCSIGNLVDDEQCLSASHGLTFGRQDAGNAARDLWTDFNNLTSCQASAVLAVERHIFLAHHHCFVLGCIGCLLFLTAAGNGQQTDESKTEIRIAYFHVVCGVWITPMHRQRPCRLQG